MRHQPARHVLAPRLTTGRRTAGLLLAATALVATAIPASSALAEPGIAATADSRTPLYLYPELPTAQRVLDLLGRMTLAEKIGQMTQAERGSVDADPTQIANLNLGSLLSGGGSAPTPNTPKAWADMVDGYQKQAPTTRLHIPLLYGIDSVHGAGNLVGATIFPQNIGMGATRDPQLVAAEEHITATETRATGPQWVFAPCVCVTRDERWGRTYESFGEDPRLVQRMTTAVDGFQGTRTSDLARPDRVLATVKHFAGDGDTTYGTSTTNDYTIDRGVTITSHRRFQDIDLAPYVTAVQLHHVGSIMPSYPRSSGPTCPAASR